MHASFGGHADAFNGKTLVQSVFFHSERCYLASAEFGFSRYIKGLPDDDKVVFYYEVNANCQPAGKCRDHSTGAKLVEQRVNLPIPIPPGTNERGGTDWLYEAYLVNGGSQWHIRVLDPYSHRKKAEPVNLDVGNFFRALAEEYAGHGATGYVTATSTRDGSVACSTDPPVLNIVKIYAAK